MTWVVERADRTPRSTTMNTNTPTVENQIDTIKIAIDMHLKSYRVVRQLDFSAPQPAGSALSPRSFIRGCKSRSPRRAASWSVTKRVALATSRRGACKSTSIATPARRAARGRSSPSSR